MADKIGILLVADRKLVCFYTVLVIHVLLQVLHTFWAKLTFTFLKGITVTFVTLISAQTAWPASSPGLNYQNEMKSQICQSSGF